MTEPGVTTDVRSGGVGVLSLSRPDRLNSISTAVGESIGAAVEAFTADPAVRAIVVAGEGKVFCAGADISELSTLDGAAGFSQFVGGLTAALDVLAACPKPSVAALHGVAFGGGLELALACDLRVAEVGTRLGVPEIKLGLLPGAAGTVRLPRMLPVPVARQMLLTGEPIGAEDALRYGLIAEVVTTGEGLNAAVALAGRLATLPPLALAAAKRLLASGTGMSEASAIELERQTVSLLFATEDRVEGLAAFLEKRPASFRGK